MKIIYSPPKDNQSWMKALIDDKNQQVGHHFNYTRHHFNYTRVQMDRLRYRCTHDRVFPVIQRFLAYYLNEIFSVSDVYLSLLKSLSFILSPLTIIDNRKKKPFRVVITLF